MFSTIISDCLAKIDAVLRSALTTHTPTAIQPWDIERIISLLMASSEQQSERYSRIIAAWSEGKRNEFGNRVFAIAPLYVSSVCAEHCLYCNYRAANTVEVERVRLSDEDLGSEIDFLIRRGLRTIELVYATDPLFRIDSICRHVELTQRRLNSAGGGLVGLNAEAFDETEYRRLVDAGLDFIVLWQETYDREVYSQMHPGRTKKTNFEFRVNAYERMLAAGIKHIGLGVLSGLADWRRDWAMLFHHQDYLRSRYHLTAPIIGLPRLKPAAGALVRTTTSIPTDDEFLLCVALQGLFDPLSLPFVSTREDWDLCVRSSSGGGTLFTFNCSTIPGGYSLGHAGYQFPTNSFDVESCAEKASVQGLHPVLNWKFDDLGVRKALSTPTTS